MQQQLIRKKKKTTNKLIPKPHRQKTLKQTKNPNQTSEPYPKTQQENMMMSSSKILQYKTGDS